MRPALFLLAVLALPGSLSFVIPPFRLLPTQASSRHSAALCTTSMGMHRHRHPGKNDAAAAVKVVLSEVHDMPFKSRHRHPGSCEIGEVLQLVRSLFSKPLSFGFDLIKSIRKLSYKSDLDKPLLNKKGDAVHVPLRTRRAYNFVRAVGSAAESGLWKSTKTLVRTVKGSPRTTQ